MYVFTQKVTSELTPTLTLALTAEERIRSRYRYTVPRDITEEAVGADRLSGSASNPYDLYLELPRGTTLQDGDCIRGDDHSQVLRIVAKPEPVITVRATGQPWLLRAAYHLGNRHVALEVGDDYLRLSPDPVLESMLKHFEVTVTAEIAPFQPESGAYGHQH
ncbi:MAG: urease accessory protein UreE [Cyanobacteria bacterium P01_F01_bin.116]